MIFINEETEFIAGGDTNSVAVSEMDALISEEGILIDCFSDDEMGAVEICLEMETSWAALVQDMSAIEHKSIINENEEILNEGLKSWWAAIVNFFKRIWAAISGWFRKVWDWISRRFQNAEKWWKANEKAIPSNATTKFDTYPNIVNDTTPVEYTKLVVAVKNATSKEAVAKAMKNGSPKEISKTVLGSDTRSEHTISKASIAKILVGSNVALSAFKNAHSVQAATLRAAQNVANTAMKNADTKKESGAQKKQVELAKAQLIAFKSLDGVGVKAVNTGVSEMFAAAKQMLRESGKAKK
jgi:hypothetical protein